MQYVVIVNQADEPGDLTQLYALGPFDHQKTAENYKDSVTPRGAAYGPRAKGFIAVIELHPINAAGEAGGS